MERSKVCAKRESVSICRARRCSDPVIDAIQRRLTSQRACLLRSRKARPTSAKYRTALNSGSRLPKQTAPTRPMVSPLPKLPRLPYPLDLSSILKSRAFFSPLSVRPHGTNAKPTRALRGNDAFFFLEPVLSFPDMPRQNSLSRAEQGRGLRSYSSSESASESSSASDRDSRPARRSVLRSLKKDSRNDGKSYKATKQSSESESESGSDTKSKNKAASSGSSDSEADKAKSDSQSSQNSNNKKVGLLFSAGRSFLIENRSTCLEPWPFFCCSWSASQSGGLYVRADML